MKQLWAVMAVVIMGVVGANFFFVCRMTQADYEQKLNELGKERQAIFESEYSNNQLKLRVAHLKTDLGVEEVAREKLGYVYADETAYVVLPAQPAGPVEPASFPMAAQPKDDNSLFFAFVHAAFGPDELAHAAAKKAARS